MLVSVTEELGEGWAGEQGLGLKNVIAGSSLLS